MSDYSYAAEQMKEKMIRDYLKKNPGVRRDQLVVRMINGRICIDRVDDVFTKVSKQEKTKRILSKNDQKLLQKLSDGGDHRFVSSMKSVDSTKSLLEGLTQCPFIEFSEEQRQEHVTQLDDAVERLEDASIELFKVREKYAEVTQQSVRPLPSLIQTMSMELIEAIMKQLTAQAEIYNQEIKIGNFYSKAVRHFFVNHYQDFENLDPKIINYIAQSCTYLKSEKMREVAVNGADNHEKFREALDRLDEQLRFRRKQYKQIQKLLAYLSDVLQSNDPDRRLHDRDPEFQQMKPKVRNPFKKYDK